MSHLSINYLGLNNGQLHQRNVPLSTFWQQRQRTASGQRCYSGLQLEACDSRG
ncbi:MAG TPA: hypothetical protein VH744_13160 [Terriglobales bacterium]